LKILLYNTECPDEALGRDGRARHADAIALGEADETWPRIVADAVPVDNSRKSLLPWMPSGSRRNPLSRIIRRQTEGLI
jgi:hypothetical protein